MKKIVKITLCALLAFIFVFQAVACSSKKGGNSSVTNPSGTENNKKYDSETTPLRLAIGLPDGVFHPMFSTSAYDSEIAGMTQIGMLSSDKNGEVAYGEDEMVVTLDLIKEMIDAEGNTVTDGSKAAYTTYSFLLKNGIKFSDGKDLTIKDVLFNMYCLLDPSYNGSATMYSVDIVGLAAYRTQNPNADKDYQDQLDKLVATKVTQRLDRFCDYYTAKSKNDTAMLDSLKSYEAEIKSDYELACKLFKEELNTDYVSAIDSVTDYREDYAFKYGGQAWEVFCLNEGLISMKVITGDKYEKDPDGKYVLNDYSDIYEAVTNAGSSDDAIKNCVINLVYSTNITNTGIITVVKYWATSTNIREELKVVEMAKLLQSSIGENGELKVKNISGITYEENVTSFNGVKYDEGHTVLTIKINGVDPKAIWDFAFSVTPMHYYSNKEECDKWDGDSHFGVKFDDPTFRDTVLKDSNKIGLPVGAGPYKASNAPGTNKVDKTTFFNANMVYFERNEYFYTVGKGMSNPKIKYIRYKVVSSEQMLSALENDEIDFAEVSAKEENISELKLHKDLLYSFQDNNGYGYVGINPRYVPDPVVRRAIMYAMDTSIIIKNYYTNGMGSVIYRPMSSTSWAYPKGIDKDYYHYDDEVLVNKISEMLEAAGYTKDSKGILRKQDSETGAWQTLKYTFTIAGETNDHPAYTMFAEAKRILEQVGMDITIKNDAQALSKLSNGSLAVWAAAWSSAIDPDMYQVYHKNSTATSVLNWGYKEILNDTKHTYNQYIDLLSYSMKYVAVGETTVTTRQLIEELSTIIDLARSTLDQQERAAYYADALDVVMELGFELPTYQRKNLYAYNSKKLDSSTMTPENEITLYNGLMSKIWEIDYN